MAQQLYLSQIAPETQKWRAKVLVEEKSNVYESGKGHRLQKLILRDEHDNRVQGLIWNADIEALKDTLQPYKTYFIGGAAVQHINPNFIAASNGLTIQWVLGRTAFILPVTDNEIPYPVLTMFHFDELPNYIQNQNPIDLLAVVAQVRPPKQRETKTGHIQLQEFIVIHQEMKPFLLTLWGDFVDHQGTKMTSIIETMPIILCKRLKATSYAGTSLATTNFSYIGVDPDIPQATDLKNWAHNNVAEILMVMNENVDEERNPPLAYNPNEEIIPVAYIEANNKNSWVKVNISFTHLPQEFCFMSCPECSYRTSALSGEEFRCNICKKLQIASPRCKVYAELRDESGSIRATFFDKNAEKILKNSPSQIETMSPEKVQSVIVAAEADLEHHEIIVEIKTNKQKYGDGNWRHTVQKWFISDNNTDIKITTKENVTPTGEAANQTDEADTMDTGTSKSVASSDNPMKKLKKLKSNASA